MRRIYTQYASKVFFTMEAVDPADNYSLYSLRTWVKHDEHADTVLTTWETCFCDVKGKTAVTPFLGLVHITRLLTLVYLF